MSFSSDSTSESPRRQRSLLSVLAFFIAALLTLLLLIWAFENWRGQRAWKIARAELIARGEPLTIEQLLPASTSDEQNFAATPLLSNAFVYRLNRDIAGRGSAEWKDPEAFARISAIPTVVPQKPLLPGTPKAKAFRNPHDATDGRTDLRGYALAVRLATAIAPATLSEELAERYGLVRNSKARPKVTNEVEIAAAIVDPAQEMLEYLARFEPELKEIEEAVRRPSAKFPIHFDEGFNALLPHLSALKKFSTLFEIRAAAKLAKGDTTGAFEDVMTCLRLANSLRTEPLFISQLVRASQQAIATHAAWEGMIDHRWNQAQLAALQAEFARVDFRASQMLAVRGERIMANATFDAWISRSAPTAELVYGSEDHSPWDPSILRRMPGWIRQNQVRQNRFYDVLLESLGGESWPKNLAGVRNEEEATRRAGLMQASVYNVLARMLAPAVEKMGAKAARAQTTAKLAEVACALERFHIARGSYPGALTELTPDFLASIPQDPMTGQPFQYERVDNKELPEAGWFRLWSVGLNRLDDGGTAQENNDAGDWVWPLPIKEPGPRLF